ncbi:MAG: DUF1835 domain-containing protein [Calditrichaceae bacterium]
MLHITNGDLTAKLLRCANMPGIVLPWKDILHEGPVPGNLSLNELSVTRAKFIAGNGWGNYRTVQRDFNKRDNLLTHFKEHEEVIFWFDDDLYDQLQLLQLFGWFRGKNLRQTKLSNATIPRDMKPTDFKLIGQFYRSRIDVTPEQLETGYQAWSAFTASEPGGMEDLLGADTSAMSFLKDAILRLLKQFPSASNGLSCTERHILEIVLAGRNNPDEIFSGAQSKEPRPFMGDLPFWSYVQNLTIGARPLLKTSNDQPFRNPSELPNGNGYGKQRVYITPLGIEVLRGQADWIEINGINRWIGGIHLTKERFWRWNENSGKLIRDGKAVLSEGQNLSSPR